MGRGTPVGSPFEIMGQFELAERQGDEPRRPGRSPEMNAARGVGPRPGAGPAVDSPHVGLSGGGSPGHSQRSALTRSLRPHAVPRHTACGRGPQILRNGGRSWL